MSAATPKAKIYDLGYKRYLGTRRSQATRWQVITRDQIAQGWKKWFRWKLALGLATLITAIVGAILVFTHSDKMGGLKQSGTLVKMVDQLVFSSFDYYTKCAFIMAIAAASVVASDLKSGAFTFYFARPVRPIDYVLGKFMALFVAQASVILVPMLIIAGVRCGLSSRGDLVHNLGYLPKALVIGTVASLEYAALSLAFSSMFTNRWANVATWCGYYLLLSNAFVVVGFVTKIWPLMCLEPHTAVTCLAYGLYDVTPEKMDNLHLPGWEWGLAGALFNVGASLTFAYWRVRGAAHRGIGGG
jgi:ABC-type transport system involved in multi-copper enzyme maturation permease subunit